jgi:hypothetical protein
MGGILVQKSTGFPAAHGGRACLPGRFANDTSNRKAGFEVPYGERCLSPSAEKTCRAVNLAGPYFPRMALAGRLC